LGKGETTLKSPLIPLCKRGRMEEGFIKGGNYILLPPLKKEGWGGFRR